MMKTLAGLAGSHVLTDVATALDAALLALALAQLAGGLT
jgi:hypothetical protein